MKLKKTTALALCSGVVALGVAGHASASVYAGSATEIANMQILIYNGVDSPAAAVGGHTFTTSANSNLNSVVGNSTSGACGGTGTLGGGNLVTTCGGAGNTIEAGDVLSFGASNAGGTATRADTDYISQFGPSGNEYSNSNARIKDSELTEGLPSATNTIAESELQFGESALSSAEINSNTGLTFTFNVATDNALMDLSFDASKFLLAEINDTSGAVSASASSSMEMRFTLQNNDTGTFWQWQPQGTGNTGCFGNSAATGAFNCNITADAYDMNDSAQVNQLDYSTSSGNGVQGGLANFHVDTGFNLDAGNYSLTLYVKNSNNVSRVPEPGSLLLLGAGIAGIGFVRRKRK